jgi:hypothetical protein
MTRALLPLLIIATIAVACGTSTRADGPSTRDPNRITHADVQGANFLSTLQAIEALRPRWLRTRGGQPAIYIDGMRSGRDALSRLPTSELHSAEYLSASQASTRFGLNHLGGAIVVATARAR